MQQKQNPGARCRRPVGIAGKTAGSGAAAMRSAAGASPKSRFNVAPMVRLGGLIGGPPSIGRMGNTWPAGS